MTGHDGAGDAEVRALLIELRRARNQPADAVSWDLLLRLREAARRQLDSGDRLREVLDPEDLAQDALLALIAAIDDFRGSTWPQLLAFVRALAQRRKIDAAGRHRRLLDEADATTAAELADAGKAPGSALVADEDRLRARALVAALPSATASPCCCVSAGTTTRRSRVLWRSASKRLASASRARCGCCAAAGSAGAARDPTHAMRCVP